jgi:mannose-6-phosphate isomerase-like protein (cupin superfamily)
MIENIIHNNVQISMIIRSAFQANGIKFFTPDSFSQQLAYMNRPKGYSISPHIHNFVKREVSYTQEVLLIKSGKVRVDYYDDNKTYLESKILYKGDVVLLSGGGHGFHMYENSEIIEIKQGPYAGDKDKTRFDAIDDQSVVIK